MTASRRDDLILEHLPQVRLIARRIHERLPGNVSLEDLISAGTIGLISAIDRFDPALGVQLKTYAEYKIRGAVLDSLRTSDWAPRQQRRRSRLIDAASTVLRQRLQRSPSEDEIAAELGIGITEYRDWAADSHSLALGSLDSTGPGEDGRDLLSFVSATEDHLPSHVLELSELEQLVARALDRMPLIERKVLNMYYLEERTLRDISNELHLHESRISQLKSRGVARLRTFLAVRWPDRGATVIARVA